MRRTTIVILSALLIGLAVVAPVAGKEFGRLYADGDVYRTFGNPARVDPGTGRDPIATFENSTNPDQLSVAGVTPGNGSHGGRWAVHHATWVNVADAGTLVTSWDQLMGLVDAGQLTLVRDEAADFRCPILPNG